ADLDGVEPGIVHDVVALEVDERAFAAERHSGQPLEALQQVHLGFRVVREPGAASTASAASAGVGVYQPCELEFAACGAGIERGGALTARRPQVREEQG